MARKRTGGAKSAARSAAAKKGWETRRRGGAAAKPAGGGKTAATRPTKSKAKPAAAPAKAPKTTTARGRARTKAAEARKALKAGGGTRAARSLLTAQRAADYYKATGTGTKRSKSKATAARAKVAARPRSRVVAGPAPRKSSGDARQRALINYNKALRKTASLDAGKKADVALATARRALGAYAGEKPVGRPIGFTSRVRPSSKPVNAKGKTLPHSEAMARRTETMLRRGVETGNRARSYLQNKGSMSAPLGSRLSMAEGRASRVSWANQDRLNFYSNQRLIAARQAAKPAAQRSAAKPRKVDLSASAIARRRSRAMAERSSIAGGSYNMKLDTRSRIIRSAANAIYNRQRQVARLSGGSVNAQVARNPIGILRGLSGSTRQRADQLREQSRKRVVSGRRR